MEPKREYTIKLRFGAGARNPSNTEIFKFFNKQEWTSEDLSAMYRDDHCVFVRFRTEQLMRGALTKLGAQVKFDYDDGTSLEVPVTAASGSFKYVRIFGLPPEVDDKFIASAMAKYGTVQQLVRERFPVETGFPIWNGVRGVHIEVVAEIPAQLTIQHVKARIYYDGLQNKCFGCGALDHLKASCPNRKSVAERLKTSTNTTDGSFASVVVKGTKGKGEATASSSGMVVLNKGAPLPKRRNSNDGTEDQSSKGTGRSSQSTEEAEKSDSEEVQQQQKDVVEPKPDEDQTMEEEEDEQENEDEAKNNGDSVEPHGEWKEAKTKGKRGRPHKGQESDSSESDARGGKQFIVPTQSNDLLRAQAIRDRSRSRSASGNPKSNVKTSK